LENVRHLLPLTAQTGANSIVQARGGSVLRHWPL
jgi:hypothetical protein